MDRGVWSYRVAVLALLAVIALRGFGGVSTATPSSAGLSDTQRDLQALRADLEGDAGTPGVLKYLDATCTILQKGLFPTPAGIHSALDDLGKPQCP